MKKAIFMAIAVVFAFGMILAVNAEAKVLDTFHDFSENSQAWIYKTTSTDQLGAETSQMCVFCHHPHRSSGLGTFTTNEVLWNQVDQDATYAVYNSTTSSTINGTATTISNSSGVRSYLCMACHDGDIAPNSLVATPGDGINTTLYDFSADRGALGSTLEDDHPVNITYANTIDDGLSDNIVNSAIDGTYPLFGTATKTVQCATCHDVHDGQNTASTGVQFMRSAGWQLNSAICTACHTNK